MLCSCLSTS